MSVTNFRRASLKAGFPKTSEFADIPYVAPLLFVVATGGTVTSSGGNTIHTFTGDGSFVTPPQLYSIN